MAITDGFDAFSGLGAPGDLGVAPSITDISGATSAIGGALNSFDALLNKWGYTKKVDADIVGIFTKPGWQSALAIGSDVSGINITVSRVVTIILGLLIFAAGIFLLGRDNDAF